MSLLSKKKNISNIGVIPLEDETTPFTLYVNGQSDTYLSSVVDGDILKQYINPFNSQNNKLFEFLTGSLSTDEIFQGGDNNAPIHINNTTLGGSGHSWGAIRLYTTSVKNDADIGSIWTDGTSNYVLSNYSSGIYILFVKTTGGNTVSNLTLTHVSGASNTSDIVGTSQLASQVYPIWSERTLTMKIDGTTTDINSASQHNISNNVTFIENYNILPFQDIVDYLTANVGTLNNTWSATGNPVLSVHNEISFTRNDMTMKQTINCLEDIASFQDAMAYQGFLIMDNGIDDIYMYYPKTLPFTASSVNWDLANKQNTTGIFPLSLRVNIPSTYWETTGLGVNRFLSMRGNIGIVQGYLPLYSATGTNRRTLASRSAIEISTSSKQYNHYIDTATISSLTQGDNYTVISYRSLYRSSSNRTSFYWIDSKEGEIYFFMDWHNLPFNDAITIPERFVGQSFQLVEKSSNVSYTGSTFQNTLNASVDNSRTYGYLILKVNY